MEEFPEVTALVADRGIMFRHGLIRVLQEARPDWSCAEAGSAEEVQAHLGLEPVDVVLLDMQLAGGRALTNLHRLRGLFPSQKIAVLSDTDERGAILECLAAGANGYILKSVMVGQLLLAIETILSGDVFAPAALAVLPQRAAPTREPEAIRPGVHLTERQLEIFQLLCEGCATKTIARRLGLAVGTVKVHLAGIYRMLGTPHRVEAIAKAGGAHLCPVRIAAGAAMAGAGDGGQLALVFPFPR